MIRAYRILRRLVRRATKPVRLWLNAWQHKQVEEEVEYLQSLREDAAAREHALRREQVKLQMRRNEIGGW